MAAAGLVVESAKGECNLGQHEIAFKYADVLSTADRHVVYKTGAKEIAARHGKSITFMAKYNEREGSSCHIHMSLRGADGTIVFDEGSGPTAVFERFVAGVLATAAEFTLLYAPNINSYKRYQPGTFAPTALAWGRDNRTCALRVVGHGSGLRVENRVPGADVNPYLALAGMLAGGLHGIEQELPLEPPLVGNAYATDRSHVPSTLRDAADAFDGSKLAREAFGDEVVAHLLNQADVELAAFGAAVTDWERLRGFERL
jgi:glutamine synthetase